MSFTHHHVVWKIIAPIGLGVLLVALVWGPAMGALPVPGAATSATRAATSANSWGGAPLSRPQTARSAAVSTSSGLVQMPAAQALMPMPTGRLTVYPGRFDTERVLEELGGSCVYVLRAEKEGIVEFLYPETGHVNAGDILFRIYDPSILPDLRRAESAMARYASRSYTIVPAPAGMPSVPPVDFPMPTTAPRLFNMPPIVAPLPEPAASRPTAGLHREGASHEPQTRRLAALSRAGSSRENTTQQAPAKPAEVPASRPATPALSAELAETQSRLTDTESGLASLEQEIGLATANLQRAEEDVAAREKLFQQGVLARKALDDAQADVRSATEELKRLQEQREKLLATRGTLQRGQARLTSDLERMKDSATAQDSSTPPQPSRTQARANLAPAQAPSRPAAAAPRDSASVPTTTASQDFPAATRPPRPELQDLPRTGQAPTTTLRPQPELPPLPREVKHLSEPRWADQQVPTSGIVTRQLVPEGTKVKPGQAVLEVVNSLLARVYAEINLSDINGFPKGAPVYISFDRYPGMVFEGWINAIEPVPATSLAQVEMVVFSRESYFGDDAYSALQWLALSAPLGDDTTHKALQPAPAETAETEQSYLAVHQLLPIVPPDIVSRELKPLHQAFKDGEYLGVMQVSSISMDTASPGQDETNRAHLEKLRKWREEFTAGMNTAMFGDLVLTYPRDGEIAAAVERMAMGRVSNQPNMCARTMREALGWGLGDAAMWIARLPERGYKTRPDGLARPGDILVWPFTYGSRRTQHIGIAVSQGGELKLLSNLTGNLGTTELLPGFVAFYHPQDQSE